MINFTKEEARKVLAEFVDKHKVEALPYTVEGSNGSYVFAARQNCMFFFEVSPTCKKYGGLYIDILFGRYRPEIEIAITEGKTVFDKKDLEKFTPFDGAVLDITFDYRDHKKTQDDFKTICKYGWKIGLMPDSYMGVYPDNTKAKSIGLLGVYDGITTIETLKNVLDSFWDKYFPKFQELAKLLNIDK